MFSSHKKVLKSNLWFYILRKRIAIERRHNSGPKSNDKNIHDIAKLTYTQEIFELFNVYAGLSDRNHLHSL